MYKYAAPDGQIISVQQPRDLVCSAIRLDYDSDVEVRNFLMNLADKLVDKNILSFQDILDITLGGGRQEIRHD